MIPPASYLGVCDGIAQKACEWLLTVEARLRPFVVLSAMPDGSPFVQACTPPDHAPSPGVVVVDLPIVDLTAKQNVAARALFGAEPSGSTFTSYKAQLEPQAASVLMVRVLREVFLLHATTAVRIELDVT